MRGARAYWIITGYLAFLSFILFMQYSLWWSQVQARGGGFSMGSKIGQGFFWWIVGTQMFLVAFITPAITSGAITIEKEQRTMEMLEITRLSRGSIVAGKLLSAVGFVALLVISSLPLTSICFFLGGVSPEEVVRWYLLLIAFSFVTATLGLVWSTVARTTAAAVLLTYGSLLVPILVFISTSALAGPAMYFGGGATGHNPTLSLIYVLSMLGVTIPNYAGAGPLGAIMRSWDGRHYFGMSMPPWVAPVMTFSLLGLTLAAVATARLESFPERKAGRLRLLVILLLIQQLFFFFGARFSAYSGAAAASGASLTGAFPLLYMLTYPTILLLILIPIFATGEIRTSEARNFTGYLAAGWSRVGIKRGRVASGLPYLLGLIALIAGMYCLSYVLVGKPSGITRGMPAAMGVRSSAPTTPNPTGSPAVTTVTTTASESDHGADLLKVITTLIASVVGLSTVGLLFTAVTRNRWTAMTLLYAVILVIIVAPAIARADYNASQSGAPSIFINLYYLNPLMAIAELSENTGQFWNNMNLMFGQIPIWAVTTVLWLFIAGVSLLMMLPFVNKIAARPVLPYEDHDSRY